MQSVNIADGNGKNIIGAPDQQMTLFKSMLELESLFDFSLYGYSLADGEPVAALQPIRTFKFVLAAGSKYFLARFTNNFNDSQKNKHTSVDFSHECLQSMVEFLHKGSVRAKSTQLAIELLNAAQFYEVDTLVTACETCLVSQLKVDNGIDWWKFACDHDWSSTFVADIEKFVAKNLKQIVNERNFLTLEAEELCALLSIKPVVSSVSADVCLRAALAWIEHDPENRKDSSAAVLDSTPLCPGIISRQVLTDACRSEAMSPFAKEKLLALSAYHHDPDYSGFIPVPDYVEPSSSSGVSTSSSIEELYFIGGFCKKQSSKQFSKYNVNRKEWVQLEPLPWKRSYGGAGVFDGDRLLVFGGKKDDVSTADVDEFNLSSSTWSKISTLQTATWSAACGSQKNAYLSDFKGQFITYSAPTNKVVFKKNMLCTRFWHSTLFSAKLNSVFVADGSSGFASAYYPRIDRYDIASDAWQPVGFAKIKCRSRASALCGDELYLTGGRDQIKGAALQKVEVCNVRTGKVWSAPDLPEARVGCQAALLYNNVICVFGGSCTQDVAAYDVREGKWTTSIVVPDMLVQSAFFGFAWK